MIRCLPPVLAAVLVLDALAAQDLPRYQFEVGQKIVYAGGGVAEASYGTTTSKVTWTFWVVDRTSAGGYRIVLKRTTKRERTMTNGKEYDYPASDSYGWVDMYPDGRFTQNQSIALGLDPSVILVPLPKNDDEVDKGWKRDMPIFNRVYACTAASEGDTVLVKVNVTSPSHRNYERTEMLRVTWHKKKGLPIEAGVATQATWRSKSTNDMAFKLESVSRGDSDWPKKFAKEFQVYAKAKAHYDEITFAARTQADKKDELLAKAIEELQATREDITLPEVQKPFDKLIAGHGNRIKYVTSYAERFAPVMHRPSKPWAAKTIAGEPRNLMDYKGKVVVLDFWYRGCGWCVRAMPQMNALHDHYKGRSVAIVGVSKDKDPDDAKFTVKAVGLKYENLLSETIHNLYGVRGFPTLVVLDKKGVVRDIHVGYSPSLKKDLVKVIDGLLAEQGE